MRGAILATAAAFLGSAVADVAHMRRHGHDAFHHRRSDNHNTKLVGSSIIGGPGPDATCGCTTKVVTYWGHPTPVPVTTAEPEPTTTVTSKKVTTLSSTSTDTVTVTVSPSTPSETPTTSNAPTAPSTPATSPTPEPTLPTPSVTSFSSTGVYTIPATTMTVTDYTTVCGATTTDLPSGTQTYGGVTTVVETSTTVTCPVATVKPSGSTVTSTIETTTYVCPSSGTYTIAPTTTFCPSSTVMVYPTPATFTPGTYSHPEQTVTVTRSDYTYVCPFTGANEPTSSPTPQPTTASASATQTPSSTSTPLIPSIGLGDGDQMGITYTPYDNDGGCKSKAAVLSDIALAKLKGFTHVRIYGTDCDTLENVGTACELNNLKMIVGVFIKSSGIQGAQDSVQAICDWAKWDMVSLIVVGNEAVSSGYVNAGSLAGFISSSAKKFKQAGYNGEVSTTEPINIWQQYGNTLCPAVDVVGANIHPFFNSQTTAKEAGKFVQGEVDIIKKICGGDKKVLNLETGWPSKGNPNGKAVPSPEDQEVAIKGIRESFGSGSVFFSYANDQWKSPGPWGVEQWWGCIDAF